MSRPKRILTNEFPLHIVQRGHDKNPVYRDTDDRLFFIDCIAETKKKIPLKIFAFCLMTNHFHIVLQSIDQPQDISRFMRDVTSVYSKTFNAIGNRTGTLWEGRFKSSLIQTDEYLLACNRYVELNPVRAKIVKHPQDYPWSSFHHRAGISEVEWLDADPSYLALGNTPQKRAARYAEWMERNIPKAETEFIQSAIRREFVLGDLQFKRQLASKFQITERKWF